MMSWLSCHTVAGIPEASNSPRALPNLEASWAHGKRLREVAGMQGGGPNSSPLSAAERL